MCYKDGERKAVVRSGGGDIVKNNSQSADEFMPLRDMVYKSLRKDILTGRITPGDHLLELEISDKLGVSRTPVREALRMLELEGLVTMQPRRGARVSKITEKSMQDVLEVRESLDALCVELACDRITTQEKEELHRACEAFEKAVATNDSRKIAEADVRFHDILIKAAKNDRLVDIEGNLSQSMYRFRYEYINEGSGHDNLVKEHRRIYDSIIKGDRVEAAVAARVHIENQRAAILSKINEK